MVRKPLDLFSFIHFVGLSTVGLAVLYVFNNFLMIGFDAPGILNTLGIGEEMGVVTPAAGYTSGMEYLGYAQTIMPIFIIGFCFQRATTIGAIRRDVDIMDGISSFTVRFAFWAVFMIGLFDAFLSFLRVEGLHVTLFGENVASIIALPSGRGLYFHIPLMVLAAFIGYRDKSISLIWLTLLVVISEILIVIARFIYGYEQTFMGDLVRFWYAALFLFASAYTLKEDGHVRVDVLYAGLKHRTKCILNTIGTLFFGLPLCWMILARGMWNKTSLINSPLLSFETSMSGFGMYIKYMMAGFLIIFAISMIFQFASYLFQSVADIDENVEPDESKEVVTS